MKVLFLTHRLPYAPNRGDRVRAYHMVRALAPVVELDVLSLAHDAVESTQTTHLLELGVRQVSALRTAALRGYVAAATSLPGNRPLTHCLLDAPGIGRELRRIADERRPDVILAYCSGMARFALEPPLRDIPLVMDFVDVDSEKWRALAAVSRFPRRFIYAREAKFLGRFEAYAARHAQASLVVNARERDALLRLAPEATVHVVENGVALDHLTPLSAPSEDRRVVFCGVMNYQPNVEGVLWFARHVWPLVRKSCPDATFTVVGSEPVSAVTQLAGAGSGIEVTGTVPDVRQYLWNAAVSVAPLLTARGVQNKVLEALAAGLPAVVTSAVMDGLPPEAFAGCRAATSATTFAHAVVDLLSLSGAERRCIARQAVLAELQWDTRLAQLQPLLSDAALRPIPKAS